MIGRQPLRATLLLALMVGLVLPGGAFALPQTGSDLPTKDELESLLRERVEEGRVEEIVVGVRDAGGKTRVVAVGESVADPRAPSERSSFAIGSFTRVFTGILLADMARRGEVDLSDPVSRYLPDDVRMPRGTGREINLFDLATHHSGLPNLPSNSPPGDSGDLGAEYTVEEMYDFLSGVELERKVGSEYAHSELGVGLLGHALSRRSGLSYGQLVRERILEPLEMGDTEIRRDEETMAGRTRGPAIGRSDESFRDLPILAGAGAFRTSARDLLRFLEVNFGAPKTPLERSARAAREPRMAISQGAGDGPALIGLGWRIRSSPDARIVWQDGRSRRARTFVGFDPIQGVGVVVLARSRHPVDDIGHHLLDSGVQLSDVGR